jgi:hypothetical protein
LTDGERICKGKPVYEFGLGNKNQQDALFHSQSISVINPTCFEQACCSSSGGTTLYIQ